MSSLSLVAVVELIGRAMVASLYLTSGIRKVANPAWTRQQIIDAGIPMPAVAYPITLAADLIGGTCVLLGWNASAAAAVLAAFTLLIAFTVHRNWSDRATLNLFLMDITIIGGLLVIAANGAGPLSLMAWLG